jgi:hypothetical protein
MRVLIVVVILIVIAYFLLMGGGPAPTPAVAPAPTGTTATAGGGAGAPVRPTATPTGLTLQQRVAIMQTAAQTTGVNFEGFVPGGRGGTLTITWISDNMAQGGDMLNAARIEGAFRDFNVDTAQYGMFMTPDGRRGQRAVFEVYF